jgi:hypothetical protein
MKKYLYILTAFQVLFFSSCKSIHYAPNGKVENERIENTINTHNMQYCNTDIGLLSQYFYRNEIKISTEFIRNLKLPAAYKKSLLQTNDSTMILYAISQKECCTKRKKEISVYLAKVYETNNHLLNLEQEIKKEISLHASISNVKYYQLPQNKNLVKINYGILCNSKSAYNIHDYLIQWSPDKIIRITHIISPDWLHLWEIWDILLLLTQKL